MSTHRSRPLRRLSAFAAAGALAAGGLAFTATPASAVDETITNATFTWGVSGYAQDGIFGPWNFSAFTGDATFLEGNVRNGTVANPVNPDPQTEYAVDPVPATSFPTSKAGKSPNAVKFTGGEGTVDRVTGEADLDWDGSYTVNAYPAVYNAPNEIYENPSLTVNADGSGTLTADFRIGAGTDMAGDPFPEQDFGRLTIATFDAGSLSNKTIRGYRVTPDYQGVEVTPPGGATAQNRTCTDAGGATGTWGSWPAPYVAALGSHASGQSVLAHFYSTGCGGKQDNKPPLPFDVKFPTAPGEVTVSKTVFDNDDEETVTVSGSGFNPALAAGNTQPPFAGKSSGVYIAFGRFQDVWDPAAGAPSSARGLGDPATRTGRSVKWAVPASSFPGSGQDPTAASYTELRTDGSFSTTLTVKKSDIAAASGNYGIFTYRGGNPAVTEYATFTPITFADKDAATVTLDRAAYSGLTGTAVPVEVDVSGTTATPSGAVALSFDPAGETPATVVDTATLAAGAATLEVPSDQAAGTGELTVSYAGDNTHTAARSAASTLELAEQETTTATVSATSTSSYGNTRTAKVTVVGDGDGAAPAGTVTAKIGGTAVGSGTLSAAGVATLVLSRTIDVGARTVSYAYSGDDTHQPVSTTKVLNVVKAHVSTTDSITTRPTSKKTGKASIAVTSVAGSPAVSGQVVVSFKKSGSTTKSVTKTFTGGKAAITVPKLAKGTWKIYVTYNGTARYTSTASTYEGAVKVTS